MEFIKRIINNKVLLTMSLISLLLTYTLFISNSMRIVYFCVLFGFVCMILIICKKTSINIRKYDLLLGISISIFFSLMAFYKLIETKVLSLYFIKINMDLPNILFMLIFTALFFVNSLSAIVISTKIIDFLYPLKTIFTEHKKDFIYATLFQLIGYISILESNIYFKDDILRNAQTSFWTNWSRYSSDLFAIILHSNSKLFDIFPLPQIISIILISLSWIIIIHKFSKKSNNIVNVIPLGIFSFSPYWLECFSYRWDAPYMAFSVLFGLYPILFTDNRKKLFLFTFLSSFLMCTSYQSSSGILVISLGLLMLIMWSEGINTKEIFSVGLTSAFGYALSLLVFITVLSNPYVGGEGYYLSTNINFLRIFSNALYFLKYCIENSNQIWIILYISIIICFVLHFIKRSVKNKFASAIVILISLFVLMMSSFGAYIAFDSINIMPRYLYGFSLLLSIVSLQLLDDRNALKTALVIILSYQMLAFSFIYGNALHNYNEYETFYLNMLAEDISRINSNNEQMLIQIEGGVIDYPDSVKRIVNEYPIMNKMISRNLSDNKIGGWGSNKIRFNYNLNIYSDETKDIKNNYLPIVADNAYYSIKADDKYILVIIK